MVQLFTWEDGGGWAPDGAHAEIIGNDWTYKPPRGRMIRGQADSIEAAKAAVEVEAAKYAVACWARGHPTAGQAYKCPLVLMK